jgi:hypothetical protein
MSLRDVRLEFTQRLAAGLGESREENILENCLIEDNSHL